MPSTSLSKWWVAPALLALMWMSCAHEKGRAAVPEAGEHIARVWHGRTSNAKAEEYARYLGEAIRKFRTLPGNRGYQMMRETVGEETHFLVISYWENRDSIHAYAGEDIRQVHALPRDAEFLLEPERTVMNYDLVTTDFGPSPQKP
jgi:heme-degrading monooxygenase HmoA